MMNSEARKRQAPAPAPSPLAEVVLSDEFYDAYFDTMPGRCCDCPSCNYYALDYEEHKDEPCATVELIRAEVAAQLAAQREQIAAEIEAYRDGRREPVACPAEAWDRAARIVREWGAS